MKGARIGEGVGPAESPLSTCSGKARV